MAQNVMTQALSIYTLCNYGVVYTRIQSIGKEKRKRRREKELCMYIHRGGKEGGEAWQKARP
jgi:hypothetical protein